MRTLVASLICTVLVIAPATSASAADPASAPGGPGLAENFLPADKSGVGTSTSMDSTVWLTVQREGGLGEIYYPDLGTPSARTLQFVVADRRGRAVRAQDAARVETTLADPASLTLLGPDDIRLGAKWITDLELRYRAFGHVELAIGADNIFDVYPDRSPFGPRPSSIGGVYPINQYYLPYSGFSPFGFNGRFLYARASVDF